MYNSRLGQLDDVSWFEEQEFKKLIPNFPEVFKQAKRDWARLIAGVQSGLFTKEQIDQALEWFQEFPQLWETIRPNFIKTPEGLQFGGDVDDFIGKMMKSSVYRSGQGLGIIPILVAGVLLVGGVAAGLWAIAYMNEQKNVSRMIDEVTAGNLPPEVLEKAVADVESKGPLDLLNDIAVWIALGGLAWFVIPKIWKR